MKTRPGLVVGILALSVVISGPVTISVATAGNPLAKTLEKADAAFEAGEWEEAELGYRKILFVAPGHSKAKSKLKKVLRQRAGVLATSAAEIADASPEAAVARLRRAADLDPNNRVVKATYKEMGYVKKGSEWLPKGEKVDRHAAIQEAAEKRRKQLQLGDDFKVILQPPLRFYTNVDAVAAKSTFKQMTASIWSHYRAYVKTMGAFGLYEPEGGLDIVLFNTREGYLKSVGIPGSAGVYYPSRGVCYFFRDGGYNFPTMLHEMTHQLNDKMLRAHGIHGWFEEGISEYFGAIYLTNAGRKGQLGRVDASRLAGFLEVLNTSGGQRYIPMARFVEMPRAELSSRFYSQGWALVHYLMEEHPMGRAILYDYVVAWRKNPGYYRGAPSPVKFENVLKEYGLTLPEFEKAMQKFYRGN